jgi:N-acetylglutamate synthase/N-acetylornithine aminotransferase
MAKGAAMLAPSLATMLVVVTTDAVADAGTLHRVVSEATRLTFQRIDSDGCLSTNDTVLLLASGASGIALDEDELAGLVTDVCMDLGKQMIGDAEGATKDIAITVTVPPPSRTRWRSAGPSPATTCSSARSTARTPTGAGCSPRSAPPGPPSSPTRSTSR